MRCNGENVAGHHDGVRRLVRPCPSLFLVASRVPGLDDDDGLTRPGAKRVRLWRDRPPRGGVPPSSRAAFALCAARLPKTCCSQTTEKSLPLFMAPNVRTAFGWLLGDDDRDTFILKKLAKEEEGHICFYFNEPLFSLAVQCQT